MASDWRPIETAPKDCSWVLIYLPDNGDVIRAHWAEDLSGEDQPAYKGWFREAAPGFGFTQVRASPTHWMPLPTPPTQEREKA